MRSNLRGVPILSRTSRIRSRWAIKGMVDIEGQNDLALAQLVEVGKKHLGGMGSGHALSTAELPVVRGGKSGGIVMNRPSA